MEIKNKNIPAWLDKSHPNFERWLRSRNLSIARGEFVRSVVSGKINCQGLKILDLGSGEGGSSKVFSVGNYVVGYDIDKHRLTRQKINYDLENLVRGSAENLPFKNDTFDLIIFQDVIEHLPLNINYFDTLHKILKQNGIIYLSTPNKISLVNIISDPHWGVPFVSLLSRKNIRRYFLKYFRRSEIGRKDIAQLITLNQLKKKSAEYFNITLYTNHSVQRLMRGDKGIVWSSFHLNMIKLIKYFKLDFLLIKISNDKIGFINKFLTPTFYLTLKKTK
jgi:SAM-dependent methyltransferase